MDLYQHQRDDEEPFQASDYQQFQAPDINPTNYTPIIDPNPDRCDDEVSFRRKSNYLISRLPFMGMDETEPIEPKCMDLRGLCENQALGYVRSNMGLDYEFVDFATQMVSSYSNGDGYGLHFNFFARQKTAPYSPAELLFVEVAFGDPVRVIHCAPVCDQPYYLDDEERPPRSVIFHPNREYCVYCDQAKDRSLERGFFLAPPLP